jgi:hypothetical protein
MLYNGNFIHQTSNAPNGYGREDAEQRDEVGKENPRTHRVHNDSSSKGSRCTEPLPKGTLKSACIKAASDLGTDGGYTRSPTSLWHSSFHSDSSARDRRPHAAERRGAMSSSRSALTPLQRPQPSSFQTRQDIYVTPGSSKSLNPSVHKSSDKAKARHEVDAWILDSESNPGCAEKEVNRQQPLEERSYQKSAPTFSTCSNARSQARTPATGTPFKRVPDVAQNSYGSSGDTRSVTSDTSSNTEESSISSASLQSAGSFCYNCKRHPFTRKLKRCSKCSRRFHHKCAEPADR